MPNKTYKPKKDYAKILEGLSAKAKEMEKQSQEGRPSTTGQATVTGTDTTPQLADTTKPSDSSKKVIINDKTGKPGEGTVVYRIEKSKAKEAVGLIAKRAKAKGAKRLTAKKSN